MFTLPPLPLDPNGSFTLLPILGQGEDVAAEVARMTLSTGSMSHADAARFAKLVKIYKGQSHTITRDGDSVMIALFTDKTCLIGAVHDNRIDIYPQPLISLGKDAVSGLKALDTDSWKALVSTLLPYTVSAHPTPEEAQNCHCPTWSDLDLRGLGYKEDISLIETLFCVLEQPKVFPAQRHPLRVATPAAPRIPLQIMGRKLGLNGPGSVQVTVSPQMEQLNPGWAPKVRRALCALFNSDVFGDPLHQVYQRKTTNGIKPQVLLKCAITLDTSLSAHERFRKAAQLPAGIFT